MSCFIIAEAGVNHNGSLDLAMKLVDVAADSGADAVKFQTFSADRLVTKSARKAAYQAETTGAGNQYEMLKALELTADDFRQLARHCRERHVEFMSTPFDLEDADLLADIGVRAFKTPSGELTNLPYLEHVARKGKPMYVSTGMADLGEVERAVSVVRSAGNDDLTLLHCVSSYPAPFDQVNLNAMATMELAFGAPVGFSDHTQGIEACVAATAVGAACLEKHFTLDRSLPGPDHQASLEPDELRRLVTAVRNVEAALGDGVKRRMPCEEDTARVARRSVTLSRPVSSGHVLGASDLVLRRPGDGVTPDRMSECVGRTVARDLPEGATLQWADLK
ncbi:MAG: N-acetylneuraminate synthase [Fimbriimonadaceae bacterium]|nr:N-acetylneuraminate synthase [Fimbriimonadaceae bacterium]